MSLNSTQSAERVHIGFFGCRNAGKSSLVNAIIGQNLAVVSDIRGTTTDPVSKAMEILPLGPVVIIDTPGFDDEGDLGNLRISKTRQVMNKTDIGVLVVDSVSGLNDYDRSIIELLENRRIPYLIAYNKCELASDTTRSLKSNELYVSALKGIGITELKERLGHLQGDYGNKHIVGDLLRRGEIVVLVCPIDESAPKGRLILPQQQTIRDILDAGAIPVVTRETELELTLLSLKEPPKLVITDSQVIGEVGKIVPEEILLTTFSILMARYKGFLEVAVNGIRAAESLSDGDKILMAEGCTHHRQCNDIGTVKIPRLLQKYTGKNLQFVTCSGAEFPDDLREYSMVIHCGACMINERETQYRMRTAVEQNVPYTNYGICLAHITGTLERTLRLFPELCEK